MKLNKDQAKMIKNTDYGPDGKSPIMDNPDLANVSLTAVEKLAL